MKNPFLIIDGGLASAPAPSRTTSCDKVVRFENPTPDHEPADPQGSCGLRVLDDTEGFGLVPTHAQGCVLDFEYNGVPARHGFLYD